MPRLFFAPSLFAVQKHNIDIFGILPIRDIGPERQRAFLITPASGKARMVFHQGMMRQLNRKSCHEDLYLSRTSRPIITIISVAILKFPMSGKKHMVFR